MKLIAISFGYILAAFIFVALLAFLGFIWNLGQIGTIPSDQETYFFELFMQVFLPCIFLLGPFFSGIQVAKRVPSMKILYSFLITNLSLFILGLLLFVISTAFFNQAVPFSFPLFAVVLTFAGGASIGSSFPWQSILYFVVLISVPALAAIIESRNVSN